MLPLWIIDLNRDQSWIGRLRGHIQSLVSLDDPYETTDGTRIPPKVDWWYSISPDTDLATEESLEQFINTIVSSGQEFVRYLSEHSPSNECFANVCIIGNTDEEHTLKVFSTLAALIKHEKERIIPSHVHIGINIIGMLYIPSAINTYSYSHRQQVLRCIKELEIQGKVNRVDGYDKVMLFQDTQHRTEKYYPALDFEKREEFVLQCLIHLYYATDSEHPLIEGQNNRDDFFFSIGVGSLYYDMRQQEQQDVHTATSNLLSALKAAPAIESEDQSINLLDKPDEIDPERIISNLASIRKELDEILDETKPLVAKPDPDPIIDFKDKYLKRFYYNHYLRKYPVELLNGITARIARSTTDLLIKVNDEISAKYKHLAELSIPVGLRRLLKDNISVERGCFTLVEKKFTELQTELLKYKNEQVENCVEDVIWKPFIRVRLPKKYRDYFTDYHDAYHADMNCPQQLSRCDELKHIAMTKLNKLLSKEATLLSRIARAFLLGFMLVICVMPFVEMFDLGLNVVSNIKAGHVEYIPEPKWYFFLIAAVLFLIPSLIQLICHIAYRIKCKRCESQLIAYYLHDAKARLANRIVNQTKAMYQDLADLCEEYISRCKKIINETEVLVKEDVYQKNLPDTMFTQPIIGGSLFFKKSDDNNLSRILFASAKKNLSLSSFNIHGTSTRVDKITQSQYYLIAHDYNDDIYKLFSGITLHRRVDSNPNASEELVIKSKEVIRKEIEESWGQAKQEFSEKMYRSIKNMQNPPADATIGDKIHTLSKNFGPASFANFVQFCAPNGEFAINEDLSYADVKSNSPYVKYALETLLPQYGQTDFQVDEKKFKYYIFLTIWRVIDEVSLKRILPEYELENKNFIFNPDFDLLPYYNDIDGDETFSYAYLDKESKRKYFVENIDGPATSILLYTLIGDESNEWEELFTPSSRVVVRYVADEKYGKMLNKKR